MIFLFEKKNLQSIFERIIEKTLRFQYYQKVIIILNLLNFHHAIRV